MRLSIFTTLSDPFRRGDLMEEAVKCYEGVADQLVIVNGGNTDHEQNIVNDDITTTKFHHWPTEFEWPFIGQQFQRGYEACTGDWVIHADLDFIFHENDYEAIRMACEKHNDEPALSFWKYQFILPDRYTIKSRLVVAVNKGKYGDRIKFNSGGDLCQPSLDGKYVEPETVPEARIGFFNYEKILKTKGQLADDCGRMERAYYRHFGKYQMGSDGTDSSAYQAWLDMTVGRFKARSHQHIALRDHPHVMQETIKDLKPENWGYDGHGHLERNDYVKSN